MLIIIDRNRGHCCQRLSLKSNIYFRKFAIFRNSKKMIVCKYARKKRFDVSQS